MNINDWAYNEAINTMVRRVRNEKEDEIIDILTSAIKKRSDEIYEIQDLINEVKYNQDFDLNELRRKANKYRIHISI